MTLRSICRHLWPTVWIEHRGSHLLKRAGFYLPNALARYSIFCRKALEVRGRFGQLARRENMPLTWIKRLKSNVKGLSPSDHFVVGGHRDVIAGRGVNEP